MNTVLLRLSAANKDCRKSFIEIQEEKYHGVPIFDHACEYVNQSASYRRNRRKIEIIEITDIFLVVRMYTEGNLEMASKAMAGFTRELLKVDKELYPDEENHIFGPCIANDTLFKYQQISEPSFSFDEYNHNQAMDFSFDCYSDNIGCTIEWNKSRELSNVEALKLCVDLFCGNASKLRSDYNEMEKAKEEIKRILRNVLLSSYEYSNSARRMMKYYEKLNGEQLRKEY